jgi:hypothetical protein
MNLPSKVYRDYEKNTNYGCYVHMHIFTPKTILGLSVLVLGSFGACFSLPYSRLRLAPYSRTPQYSLPFSFASDLRAEALAARNDIFVSLEQHLASTQAIQRGLVFGNLNLYEFQETLATRLLIADITTDYHLHSSAPFDDAAHFLSKFVQEPGRRLELRGGCSAEEVEEVMAA